MKIVDLPIWSMPKKIIISIYNYIKSLFTKKKDK
mgnify:CR=1 FL=1